MPLAHLLGLLADDVVEDPDEAQVVFGEGGILPWQTERILALLGPTEAAVERHSDVDGGEAGRQAEEPGQGPAMRVLPSAFTFLSAPSLPGRSRAGPPVAPPD